MNATPDRARIIAPPPLLALGCIVLGFIARRFFPLRWFAPANTLPILVGVVMIAISIAVVVLARRTFIAQGTHPNPYRPTKALVMTGVFSVSRNPVYVAFLLFVLAFALLANSFWFDLCLRAVARSAFWRRETRGALSPGEIRCFL
jgi:protein-S-isoprenylcysteine O-methyltransferase Ste14